jgi:hypothetical protein
MFLGAVGLFLLCIGWRRAGSQLRNSVKPMIWLFGSVILFAVGVDMIHSLMPKETVLGGFFLILEDGGEMLMISALLSYVIGTFAW